MGRLASAQGGGRHRLANGHSDAVIGQFRNADPQVVRTVAVGSARILMVALFLKMHARGYQP